MQKNFRNIIEDQIPTKLIVGILVGIALFSGYELWTARDMGILEIRSSVREIRVFVDGHDAGTLKTPEESLRISEPAGKHTVIVSKEGYWPWTESVKIQKRETLELHPFNISQKPILENVPPSISSKGGTNANSDYMQVITLFENQRIRDTVKPLVEATRIQGVTFADYFPGRTDVILVATPDGIFAIGIEKSEHPNFQPAYKTIDKSVKGASPTFATTKDGIIYIKDGDSVFRIKNLDK